MSTSPTLGGESTAVAEARHAMQAVLTRSATDRAFRTKLLVEPHAAIADVTNAPVPTTFNVVFIENTADATIVLPDFVDPDAELSDRELEMVAGGLTPLLLVVAAAGIGLGVLAGQIEHEQHLATPR